MPRAPTPLGPDAKLLAEALKSVVESVGHREPRVNFRTAPESYAEYAEWRVAAKSKILSSGRLR